MRKLALTLFASGALAITAVTPATAVPFSSHSTQLSAEQVTHRALKLAGQEHKNVLLIFHASWCGWCHKLDDLLYKSPFTAEFASNYVIAHIDGLEMSAKQSLENPGWATELASYGGTNQGVPFWLVLSPSGKVLATCKNPTNIGFPSKDSEIAYFLQVLQKTAPGIGAVREEALKSYLVAARSTSG